MNTKMSLVEMRTTNPKEFQRRYSEWAQSQLEYEWWDGVEEGLKSDLAPLGFDVSSLYFAISYSQSDYAALIGSIRLADWARAQGYDDRYLALILDWDSYGACATVRNRTRSGALISIDYDPGNCTPSGVFKDLPQDAWDELVCEQWDAEDWEELVGEWVKGRNAAAYRQLVEEYEYLTSEEQFIESES